MTSYSSWLDEQRDYEEEEYNQTSMQKEGLEEYKAEQCEKKGLIPSEHMHGFTRRKGILYILECVDCHDEDRCEDYDCLWCVPA